MHVSVDLKRCSGYGNCVDASETVFQMSDTEDLGEVLIDEPGPELHDSVRKAKRMCPANAVVIDED